MRRLAAARIGTQHNRFQRFQRTRRDFMQRFCTATCAQIRGRDNAGLLCCKAALNVRKMDVKCSIFRVNHRTRGSWIIKERLFCLFFYGAKHSKCNNWGKSLQKDPDGQTHLRIESNFRYYCSGNDNLEP